MGLIKKLKSRSRRSSSSPLNPSASTSTRVLFVSHEATRTGAPKIILNVLKHFHAQTDVKLQSILHSGGFLAEEFAQFSEVDCLNIPREPSAELTKRVRRICTRHKDQPPNIAICNSMESRFIANELHQLGIPILFLVHELPSSYEVADYQQVYDISNRIIFPVNTVRDAADKKASLPRDICSVIPQGLLNPSFGSGIDQNAVRQQIRSELNIPKDAFIVLGCGTLDLRKGIDHYCGVARSTLNQNNPKNRPVHFVWLGEGDRWAHTPYHYTMLDVEKAGIFNHVHFIGERKDVQPWFVGSDVFILTSRVDPFPCVVHEAMASGLPVITFENAGGAKEALQDGAGVTVPYADYKAMSDAICLIKNSPAIADGIRSTAKKRVHQQYRFDNYAGQLLQICEQIIRRRISLNSDSSSDNSPHTIPWRRAA